MVDIKVGDWVKLAWWEKFYEVVEVNIDGFVANSSDSNHRYWYPFDKDWIKRDEPIISQGIDNPTPSPVREIVTKGIVDGVYGRLMIEEIQGEPTFKLVNRFGESDPPANFQVLNAKELRELAKTLNEVAEFLEGE